MSTEPSPEELFDLIVAELADRTEEYLVALREIPNVDGTSKTDLWKAAANKGDEIEALRRQLAELIPKLEQAEAGGPSRALVILQHACKATAWNVNLDHKTDRALIHECGELVKKVRDPVARASGNEWLRRALGYAKADRRDQAILCMRNAKMLLNR
jgi:hypothetical protein